jgi:L-ascorbate metabolism protein UlaG (beta-lactamase superfamily)
MKAPCKVSDLPGCDAVFISHNHYDHLDLATVTDIRKEFPQAIWFVPMGNKSWFTATGIKAENVVELDWWDNWEGQFGDGSKRSFTTSSKERSDNTSSFKVSCVPTQHTSGRAGWDKDSTLWSGWVIERFVTSIDELSPSPQKTRQGAVYHAGDTGYRRTTKSEIICPAFSEIGAKFGGFDLSFIPIWRGGSLGFISYVGLRLSHHDIPTALHCSPRDAINIHKDVKSKNTVGVHFGTFVGSGSESYDARVELWEARKEFGVKELDDKVDGESSRAGTLDIGGSLAVKVE